MLAKEKKSLRTEWFLLANSKKADFEWDTLAKFLLALVILIVIIVLVVMFKERLYNVFEALKGIFG